MATSDHTSNIPYGYCHCGCGQKTGIAKNSDKRKGIVRGEPYKFLHGHHARKMSIEQRFWSKVAISDDLNKCWEWQAGKYPDGYGSFRLNTKDHIGAHRFAWELVHGKIPDGLQVLHQCDNPSCCNLKHLFLGTLQDNMRDRDAKGRQYDRNGDKNGAHKFTWEQVRTIRKRYASGDTNCAALARDLGMDRGTVWEIVKYKTWKE